MQSSQTMASAMSLVLGIIADVLYIRNECMPTLLLHPSAHGASASASKSSRRILSTYSFCCDIFLNSEAGLDDGGGDT